MTPSAAFACFYHDYLDTYGAIHRKSRRKDWLHLPLARVWFLDAAARNVRWTQTPIDDIPL